MSVGITNGIINVLVGSNANTPILPGTVQITDPSTAGTYIADGQIVMLDSTDTPMTGAKANIGDSPYIRFVQRSGATAASANLNYSARIRGIDLYKCIGKNYVAPAEQVTNLGYNGTSGSIDITSTDYILTIVNDWDDMQFSKEKDRDAFDYSSTNPTQLSIAQSFSQQINFKGYRKTLLGTGPWISVTMLNDGTGTTAGDTSTVVNGSDIINFVTTAAAFSAIGTQLRIGSGGGVTVPVYVVTGNSTTDTSLSVTQLRVHTFYQGASATPQTTYTVAGATNYGLVFTGLPLTFGIPPYSDWKYKKVSFHLDRTGFNSTTYGTSTQGTIGSGTGALIQELEYFAQGFEGALNRTIIPLPTGRHDAVLATTYDLITLISKDRSFDSAITSVSAQTVQTVLAIPVGATQIATLVPLINQYIASVPAAFPAVSIV